MNKPTLKDFLSKPSDAMAKGFCPTFISSGLFAARAWLNKDMRESICAVTYDLFTEPLRTKPFYLLLFLLIITVAITYPFLFPVWWLLFYASFKHDYKALQDEKETNKKI